MDIGVSVLYPPWFSLEEQLEVVRHADRLGLHSAWAPEGYGQEAVALLGLFAGQTSRIGLGAGVMQIPARQPTATAMAAATLDLLSGGRMLLGLGLSGPQVSEGFFGVPFTAALGRTREYVEIVRRTLSGRPVEFEGKHWTLPLREGGLGQGKPIKLITPPVQERMPIYLGVGGAQTTRQAGEIADGWMPFLFSPEHSGLLTAPLLEGIERAGRRREDVTVAPLVATAVDEDIEVARAAVRPLVAFYFGAMGSREKNFYVDLAERYGHGPAARACQEAFLAGDRAGAAAAIDDELLGLVALVATPDTLGARLGDYARAGVDLLIAAPLGDSAKVLEALAEHLPAQRDRAVAA
ncbi:Putative coenzyme F420-dependent oxidoreductase [Paraconexibacter sp. AEG42_29]|uniref:Coenzyme F420-dependent oxidoreductase n=1 Tax=Paraconexibacter sp. AEG42_29 TaxID=2997339 RepID=A0AAU7AY28_9ACTN